MAAGVYDITCEQGATLRKTFTWLDENEQPVDLTGCDARMQVRQSHKSTVTWMSLTSTPAAGLTIEPTNGKVTLLVSAAATAALPVNKGVYDLEIVHPSGDVTRLLEGAFVVTPEVTR